MLNTSWAPRVENGEKRMKTTSRAATTCIKLPVREILSAKRLETKAKTQARHSRPEQNPSSPGKVTTTPHHSGQLARRKKRFPTPQGTSAMPESPDALPDQIHHLPVQMAVTTTARDPCLVLLFFFLSFRPDRFSFENRKETERNGPLFHLRSGTGHFRH